VRRGRGGRARARGTVAVTARRQEPRRASRVCGSPVEEPIIEPVIKAIIEAGTRALPAAGGRRRAVLRRFLNPPGVQALGADARQEVSFNG